MSGKKGRGMLRAQVRTFKKAWRRVQVNSSQLVEQLLQQLSLGATVGPACMNVYERLQQPPSTLWPAAGPRDVDDADDDVLESPAAPAACCSDMSLVATTSCFNFNMQARYQPLVIAPGHRHHRWCLYSNHTFAHSKSSKIPSNLVSPMCRLDSLSNPAASSGMMAQDSSSSTVLLKVSIVGDAETGKTSFMAKYVCPEGMSPDFIATAGVATEEKLVHAKSGTHIAFNIWDLGGHWQCGSMLPMVCRDAAAILIMFDLTRRSTLNSVMDWFLQARECNKGAMAVMIGTKYDHFVDLPQDIQRAIIQQARAYARVMRAPVFFSSVTHNINVQKVFKVIVAKLFDLPCSVPINLKFGEPLVDY